MLIKQLFTLMGFFTMTMPSAFATLSASSKLSTSRENVSSVQQAIESKQGSSGIERPALGQKYRRFIFLIHGLSGSAKTFGALPEVLTKHGSMVQPNTEFKIVPMAYNTGSPTESTYEFAHIVAKQMMEQIGTLRPTDRITLVAHSQGGLISWIWYLLSLSKDKGFEQYHAYALQTEGLMTLGSPMWGSKLASVLRNNPKLKAAEDVVRRRGRMGPKELEEMAYSSDTIVRFRNRASSLDQLGFKLPIRTLAVGGVLPDSSSPNMNWKNKALVGLTEEFFGAGLGKRAETDGAVALPAARIDFLYLKDSAKTSSNIKMDDFAGFNEEQIRRFTIVKAPHTSLNQAQYYDIAEVPAKCESLEEACTHPTYPLILGFTMACTKTSVDCDEDQYARHMSFFRNQKWRQKTVPSALVQRNMHSFILDFVLDLPENYDLPTKESVLSLLKFKGQLQDSKIYNPTNPEYYFVVDRKGEVRADIIRVGTFQLDPNSNQKQKQIRVTLHGHVYENENGYGANHQRYVEATSNGFKLPVSIELPNLPIKSVEILVRPSYSTYINLDYTK